MNEADTAFVVVVGILVGIPILVMGIYIIVEEFFNS